MLMIVDQAMAVVVGGGLNALGIVRSLACKSIPILLVTSGNGPAVRSRYSQKYLVEQTEGESLIAALKSIGRSLPLKPVLYLTQEKSVASVSQRRDEILPYYHITLPDQEILATLMHKESFQQLAERFGSTIPAAVRLQSAMDLEKLHGLRFPCVLKPAEKNYEYGAIFKKAYVVGSIAEASERFLEIAPILPDLIVQQWIEGNDSDIYFCLQYVGKEQEVVASFVGRKLRSWPPRIGGTASCTAAPEYHSELTETTSAFFRRAGFVGMGSMEYKRDSRDGRFYMVEPTVGRSDFQEEVATVNGINIPLAAYCYETGLSLQSCCYFETRKIWREPIVDRWSSEAAPSKEARRGADVVDAYWRSNDPGPWFSMIWERIRARYKVLVRGREL